MAWDDFLGNGFDDPRSGQILGLAQGLLSAPGGRGLAAGLANMREAQDADAKRKYMLAQMGLVDVQAKTGQAQLKEMERKNTDADAARSAMIEFSRQYGMPGATSPGAAPGVTPTEGGADPVRAPAIALSPQGAGAATGGQPTPAIAVGPVPPKSDAFTRYKALGDYLTGKGLPDQAQAAYANAEKFRPKYNTTPQVVRDPATGKLINVLQSEDGTYQVMPYGVKPDIQMQDLGGKVVAVDKNDTTGGQSFDKSMTPGEVASNKLGWANNAATLRGQNMSDARQREANAQAGTVIDWDRGLIGSKQNATVRPLMQDGTPIGAKEKPLTDTQAKALQFSSRMEASDKIMNDLAEKGARNVQPGSNLPVIGPAISKYAGGQPNQQLEQAQRDFVNAILRRESGAAISESEFENAKKQYFPQFWDGPDVIEQKARNRALSIAGIKAEVPKGTPDISNFLPNGKQSAISSGGWSAKKVN